MDERFLRAFTDPAESKILGRLVYPFCLRHRLQLLALGSPFVKDMDFVRPLDLLVAVKVLAGEPIGKLTNAELGEIVQLSDDNDLMLRECRKLREFMLEQNHPKFWEKDTGRAGSNGIPWILNIVTSLITSGISERRAWEMPECQAIWLATGFATLKGAELKVLTSDDEYMMANFDKILKRN